MSFPSLLGLIPFIPVIGAFTAPLIYLVKRSRSLILTYGFVMSALTLAISVLEAIVAFSSNKPYMYNAGGWPPPIGISYLGDKLNLTMVVLTSLIITLIFLYSFDYIFDDGYPWYTVLLLGAEAGLLGVILTGDAFNLFVMLEVTAVSAYGLVMYYRNRPSAIISGLKYAFIGAMGTVLYMLASAIMYNTYGSLNLIDIGLKTRNLQGTSLMISGGIGGSQIAIGLILVLSFWAFSIKSGVFPNHFWLPDAHPAAPTPISALLSGLVVNTGAIGLYKVLYLLYSNVQGNVVNAVSAIIVFTGGVSAILGGLMMIIQNDVKRLIAYSTVMNTGFIFMAVGTCSHIGIEAFVYYMIIHSLAKTTLFLTAGYLIKTARSRNILKIAGIASRNPIVAFSMISSILTLAGIPPYPGFMAKLLLYDALFKYSLLAAMAMILASAIGLISYMRLFYITLISPPMVTTGIDMPRGTICLLILSSLLLVLGMFSTFTPRFLDNVLWNIVGQVADPVKYIIDLSKYIIQFP
ncbi:MAG: proton-conducting transporter membrane subunit [Desulfurococcaceae archaeon]